MTLAAPEEALSINCAGAQLPGILHPTKNQARTGVVMIVGGRQYRVGSGRFFVVPGLSIHRRRTALGR